MTKCEQCNVVLTDVEHKNSLMAGSRIGDVVFKCDECHIINVQDVLLDISRYETQLSQTAYDAINAHDSWD